MTHHHARQHMDHQDILAWGSNTGKASSSAGEDDVAADVDEPPDHQSSLQEKQDFHKSTIQPARSRKESMLTRAIVDNAKSDGEPPATTELFRRRSMMSNISIASTADLTSDGGITSPARTNTPSPPPPANFHSFAPYSFGSKPQDILIPSMVGLGLKEPVIVQPEVPSNPAKPEPAVEAPVVQAPAPRKRCITFACGAPKPTTSPAPIAPAPVAPAVLEVPAKTPRKCTIKFACTNPKPELQQEVKALSILAANKAAAPAPKSPQLRRRTRSPSMTRKSSRSVGSSKTHSPTLRKSKPKYIDADDLSSEAIRFHEFASDEVQEDDWIRKDVSETKAKMTVNDTLAMENRLRQLGKEAAEELEEEEEEEEDDEDDLQNDSEEDLEEEDDEVEVDEEDTEEQDDQDDDDATIEGSDGNESDNEAGFADSDDESDAGGEFNFWTPGRSIVLTGAVIRSSAHRTASESSIDSLKHMSPIAKVFASSGLRRKTKARQILHRPGTPDLPDSTDFVCGTLDEDRPLEDAYVSCMEARKREKHFLIPQDIDPSFPTSDPEDFDEEGGEDEAGAAHDSDEHVWLHGQFEEDSEVEIKKTRGRATRSPGFSPKRLHSPPPPKRLHSPAPPKRITSPHPVRRLHSPPPAKTRLRSPPPRKLFGHSPKRYRSPPPARHVPSPAASPTQVITHATSGAIGFVPLGSRPGLTHTKSLPRAPNAFAKRYHAARLAQLNGGTDSSEGPEIHSRGAIDIVKGLEHKRERRKEKFFQKHCNKLRKLGQPERKPQPGKGAERMRELGLQMAGMTGKIGENRTGKAEFVLSI